MFLATRRCMGRNSVAFSPLLNQYGTPATGCYGRRKAIVQKNIGHVYQLVVSNSIAIPMFISIEKDILPLYWAFVHKAVCHQRQRSFAVGSVITEMLDCPKFTKSAVSPCIRKSGPRDDLGTPDSAKLVK